MKRLRTLLMVLAMALCLSGLSFAAEAGAIEPIDDGSVAAPQLYAGESSTASGVGSITPYTTDYQQSIVRGHNGSFRFYTTSGSGYAWMKIYRADETSDTVADQQKLNLSEWNHTGAKWTAKTASLSIGDYIICCYVGDENGKPMNQDKIYREHFTIVANEVPLTSMGFFRIPNGEYDRGAVTTTKTVTICPGQKAVFSMAYTPVNATGNRNITYTSDNPDVAAVSKWCGNVTIDAKAAGTATITATSDEKATATLTVTVAHSYEKTITTAPTCVSTGVATYTCSVCGASYTEELPVDPKAHDFGGKAPVVITPATATRPGQGQNHCTLCNQDVIVEIPPVFNDTTQEYYYDAVDYFYANGYITGTASNHFGPATPLNRAMVVTILYRMEGTPAVTEPSPFIDLKENAYYVNAVTWAYENKIVEGIDAFHFRPDQPIIRQDLATILLRYANYKKVDTTGKADLSSFADSETIRTYAKDAAAWCVEAGIINGIQCADGNTYVAPLNNTKRCDAVTMLYRYILFAKDHPAPVEEPDTTPDDDAAAPADEADATAAVPGGVTLLSASCHTPTVTLLSDAEPCAAPKVTIPYSGDLAAWWQAIVDWYHHFIVGDPSWFAGPKVTTYDVPTGMEVPT
ncbi:MAG: S-layer homology domain-containing protein [Oscillospiraceae bacterium]|nr:S-layer homology domain-containing protein [Oscillospiraceae bacterium]